MRDRRQELINYCCKSDEDRIVFVPLIEEAIFLEKRLEDLKSYLSSRLTLKIRHSRRIHLHRSNIKSYCSSIQMSLRS